MRKSLPALIFWLSVIGLFLLLLLVPRGTTSTYEKIRITSSGTPAAEFSSSTSFFRTIQETEEARYLPRFYTGRYQKKDYFFLAFYSYELEVDLASFPQVGWGEPAILSIEMPGKILSQNANKVAGNTCIWTLSLGREKEIKATSRVVRWWAVFLFATFLFGAFCSALFLKKSYNKGEII